MVVKGVLGLMFAVFVLAFLAMAAGTWTLNRQMRGEVGTLLAESRGDARSMVTDAMLADLPAPVRRYLTYTGVVGTPIPPDRAPHLQGPNPAGRRAAVDAADRRAVLHGRSITATMYFDAGGRFINFVARRYRTIATGYTLETWSTPNTGYGMFEGLRLPVSGKGVWHLAQGDQVYIELTVTGLEYDPDAAYRARS
jgi:hypothetical protein